MSNGDEMAFEWDEAKAEANVEKHGVTFEDAATVFDDLFARVIDDPDHSDDEDRFIIIGLSISAALLVVCHCFREAGALRIISARKATSAESETYWGFRNA